jgi:uncharacterized membrane protein
MVWRLINLPLIVMGFIFFLTSIAKETGSSSFFPFIIPIVGSILIIVFLSRIHKDVWIQYLGYLFMFISLVVMIEDIGSFLHYTFLGLGTFILFFNTLRPWSK